MVEIYQGEQVRDLRRLHHYVFSESYRRLPIRDQLETQAQTIHTEHAKGSAVVLPHLRCWHPGFVGVPVEQVLSADVTIDDARLTIAREFGFADWEAVASLGSRSTDFEFEMAVDELVEGKLDALRGRLKNHPQLVAQRSDYGHRSTLLHYVGANGVETYRQIVPNNLAEITSWLLSEGADVNATAEMYGGGSTTLGLLLSSCHPAEAGVSEEVAAILQSAG